MLSTNLGVGFKVTVNLNSCCRFLGSLKLSRIGVAEKGRFPVSLQAAFESLSSIFELCFPFSILNRLKQA